MVAGKELTNLRHDLARSNPAAFATGTSRNLLIQWRSFVLFCLYFKFEPLPASVQCICLFVQFLSCTFKAVSSTQNYINGLHTLHALLELPFAAAGSLDLKLTLRGLKRAKPHTVRQAAPLSPHLLRKFHEQLDLNKPVDAVMWALVLFAFFTLARKSNQAPVPLRLFSNVMTLHLHNMNVNNMSTLLKLRPTNTGDIMMTVSLGNQCFIGWDCFHTNCCCREQPFCALWRHRSGST